MLCSTTIITAIFYHIGRRMIFHIQVTFWWFFIFGNKIDGTFNWSIDIYRLIWQHDSCHTGQLEWHMQRQHLCFTAPTPCVIARQEQPGILGTLFFLRVTADICYLRHGLTSNEIYRTVTKDISGITCTNWRVLVSSNWDNTSAGSCHSAATLMLLEYSDITAKYAPNIPVKLPWIFLWAPLNINGAPQNIQYNLTDMPKWMAVAWFKQSTWILGW